MTNYIDNMNVKVCGRCGKFYDTFLELDHCAACHKVLEEQIDRVKRFIVVHTDVTLEEISVALKVEFKQLIQWVREGRLEFSEASDVTVPCLMCRTPIRVGKYCASCKSELISDLQSVYEKPEVNQTDSLAKPKSTNKMHYPNRRDKR